MHLEIINDQMTAKDVRMGVSILTFIL